MVLLPFRTVTRGRWRRARWTFLLLVGAAFALYGLTAARYAFPGHSANWIAWAAGADVREVPSRPLLTLLGHAVAGLPWGPLALRLNLLSALAGALVVGWVYRVVWSLIFDSMREESAVTFASRNARFGGFLSVLAVALSLPFWQASTRFSPEIFDFAWIMVCAHLLTVYARSQKALWLLAFGVLSGFGAAESPLFIVASPVLMAAAVVIEWKLSWCRVGRLFGAGFLSFLVLLGSHLYFARTFVLAQGLPETGVEILQAVVSVWREQAAEISRLLPKTYWLPVLGLGVVSALFSFLCALRMLDNRRSWGLLFLGVLLTGSGLLMLFNGPFTPWAVMAPKGVMPAAAHALAGMGLGLLAASWRAMSVLADPQDGDVGPEASEERDGRLRKPTREVRKLRVFMACRMTGFAAAPVLAALIGVAGVSNGIRLLGEDGSFADRAADAIVDGLKGRPWVVSNGLLDPHLLVRAHERGVAVRLLCPYRATERAYLAWLLRAVAGDPTFTESDRLRAQSLISFNLHLFIDDLFSTHEKIGGQAVCLGLPDLWYGAGWIPVPERLFYGGVKSLSELDAAALLEQHTRFWDAWKGFVESGEGSPCELSYRARAGLRRHLSFVANNLGVTLEDLGKTEEAFQVFGKAKAISPGNISALLNQFELVSRGLHPEKKDAVAGELRRRVENPRERYPLWALSRHYGYVRNYEMFVKMGWTWALSSCPSSVLAGLRSSYAIQPDEERRTALTTMMASLYEMRGDFAKSAEEYRTTLARDPKNTFAISGLVRLALQQSVGEAQKILQAGEKAGVSPRLLRQDWAAVFLVQGDLPQARLILQEMGDEKSASPMTLAMLAMVMVEQGDVTSVETTVLPRLAKAAEGKSSYFFQVVQGRVWQSKGKEGYRNARLCYQRAAALRPDVQALQDAILMLDVLLGDQKAAEAHALSVLRQRKDHPYASFIVGSIRLEQGQYGDAEAYLARSAAPAEATLAALNNYAQVLCRIRKLDEAEKVARRAAARSPERYEAWSTLAFVLASKDLLDEASEAQAKARALNKKDVRLQLVDGLIAVRRGSREAAEKAVAALSEAKDLSVADRKELQNLRQALERLAPPAP